jgi:hypothetical protein
MRLRARLLLAAGIAMLAAVRPVAAHHSFAAEFDANLPVTVSGVVTKVEWTNPHARVYVEATDEAGTVVTWDFEMAGPNGLMRLGWTRHSLPPGTRVTVTGYRAKRAPHLANASSITLSDGRKMFAGSSFEGDQAR